MRFFSMMLLVCAGGLFLVPIAMIAQSQSNLSSEQIEAKKNFRVYLEADWKHWLSEYPELATGVGERAFNRKWPDNSPEGIEARRKHLQRCGSPVGTLCHRASARVI